MLIGGDAPLLAWSELPSAELPARLFRIPHHGGALDDGGAPAGWNVDRLYGEVHAETALVSVGTNNAYGHPREDWVRPITGGTCRLLCTQLTARCHAPLETNAKAGGVTRDATEISVLRGRVLGEPGFRHWAEPQWRHLTDKRRAVQTGLLELPCAGTVVVSLHLNGAVRVLPSPGSDHDRLVDGWQHPLCRFSPP
jgi:hypothetical protein